MSSLNRQELTVPLTVSVVICAYSERRWTMLNEAIESVKRQTVTAHELVICIDHNPGLLERCRSSLKDWTENSELRIELVANEFVGRLGDARTTALKYINGDIVAFLDDDAWAETTWLEILMYPYLDSDVVAVGGAPLPIFETRRPRWFPPQLDWIFGCYYDGLPVELAPVPRMIGAAMSVRRGALEAVGGFHSDNHDDMDLCLRLADRFADKRIMLEPRAIVRHNVVAERVKWSYFWRRCFTVNRGKVRAFRNLGSAANMSADRKFVISSVRRSAQSVLVELIAGDSYAVVRFGVLLAGIGCAALGNIVGQVDAWRAEEPCE